MRKNVLQSRQKQSDQLSYIMFLFSSYIMFLFSSYIMFLFSSYIMFLFSCYMFLFSSYIMFLFSRYFMFLFSSYLMFLFTCNLLFFISKILKEFHRLLSAVECACTFIINFYNIPWTCYIEANNKLLAFYDSKLVGITISLDFQL